MGRQPPVPDRVDPAVNTMQASGTNAVLNGVLAKSGQGELPVCDHAVLPACELRDCTIRCVSFIAYVAIKVRRLGHRAQGGRGIRAKPDAFA